MKKPKIALVGVGTAGTKIANEIANSELSKDIKTKVSILIPFVILCLLKIGIIIDVSEYR